jgi:5-methylcytosine-specific restriction endonuclease McrBC regulatory subunit McrC
MAVGRFCLTEYDPPIPLVDQIVQTTGLAPARITKLLQLVGDRAALSLGFTNTPLQVAGQRAHATDFAGLLRVAPAIELEVAPKFLGSSAAGWREDFFFLAMLSRHGRLLNSDRLRAVSSANTDLATLVARALIQMYWDNHRRPMRTYRRRVENHFAIEGEVDPQDLRMPMDDGFAQTVIRFDRTNPYNAVVSAACAHLHPEVQDADVRANLERIMQSLGAQAPLRSLRPKRLPSRSQAWQLTYELALDVLRGFGVTYDTGKAIAPGFVLSTWQVWEDLVTISLRAHLGSEAVVAQKGIQLGHRQWKAEGDRSSQRSLMVTPDLKIDGSKAGFGELLVDAKYKGRWHQGRQRIAEADVYEAMAFAKASKATRIVLVYPKTARAAPAPVGTTTIFERVYVDELTIWGIEAEVRGIAGKAGLKTFAAGLVDALGAITNS